MTETLENAKMIKPIGDYLLLKPLERAGMVGLIHLPNVDSIHMKNGTICEVLAAGPGRRSADGKSMIPMDVKVGDKVHLTAYGATSAGVNLVMNGEKVVMIRARDINGVVQD